MLRIGRRTSSPTGYRDIALDETEYFTPEAGGPTLGSIGSPVTFATAAYNGKLPHYAFEFVGGLLPSAGATVNLSIGMNIPSGFSNLELTFGFTGGASGAGQTFTNNTGGSGTVTFVTNFVGQLVVRGGFKVTENSTGTLTLFGGNDGAITVAVRRYGVFRIWSITP